MWVQTFRRPLATTAGFTHFKGFPNPLREGGTATFTDLPGDATLKIFTVSGEWVQTVYADFTGQALWDGRDRDGRPAPTGVYLVRAESRGGRKTLKFAVVR
ncbi:MAG: T9SS type A sorting domain-containing protein [Elusimicrobia bacterium]|nr:T9SS type A sorting domain-containing protein [Elusimicrobiota bacterium]